MKYFSMFTGIGGFELGIQKAYYFNIARELAEQSTSARKTAAVVVRDGEIIGTGTNTHTEPCKRQGFPTGVGYDLCDGCNYDNHAEANALRDIDATGADLYLFGHYYLCQPCQDKVKEAGIANVFIKNAYVSSPARNEQGRLDVETSRPDTLKESLAVQQLDCVGYSEIDKYSIQTYERHFKHENYGDATTIDSAGLPDFNVLVGGFPCQSFSVAGKRGGFNDTRGTLFFDVARILKDKKPKHLVLENVKGLLSHDGGRTFETIIGVLTDLGYSVEWQLLNSKDFGVPQNRERVYIIGHLGGFCGRKVFPLRSDYEPSNVVSGQQAHSTTITTRYNATGNGTYIAERELNAQEDPRIINPLKGKTEYGWHFEQNVHDQDGLARTVKAGGGSGNTPKVIVPKVKQIGQIYDNPHNSQAGRVYDKEGISPTLDVAAGGNRQPKVIVGSPKYVDGKRTMSYRESDIVPTIQASQYKSGDNQPKVKVAAVRGRKNEAGEYVQTLEERPDDNTNTLTSVHKDNMVAMRWVRTEKGKEIRREAQKQGKDYTPFNGEARTLAPSDSGIIGTITSQAISKDSLLGDGMRIRRLTPRECERLQGFPDDWTTGVSDSQRYKQCGNAVTTNVVQAVFEKLLDCCYE